MTTNRIVWVHGDCLRVSNPALEANTGAPALYVWDTALLQAYNISLKRIAFMYECLIEMPVHIRRGDVISELVRFSEENESHHIATTPSPSPLFKQYCRALEQRGFEVEIYEEEAFINYDGHIDLKRFSRYWRKVEKYAFN